MSYYIIIRGPLGCGKSTISERLAMAFNAEHISVDRVLDDHGLTDDKEDGYISQASFKRANEIITPKAKEFLDNGKTIVFDGNFYWKSQLDDLIQRLDYPHYVFTLKVPLELCIVRDHKRDKTHGKDAAEAVYAKSTSFEYGMPIDATGTIDETINKICSFIPALN
ncbi:MAG: ATP-binding protein [Patescibacteria group bacterium]|jgi:predicted kinase